MNRSVLRWAARMAAAGVLALGAYVAAAIAADASRFAEGRLFRIVKPGIADSFVFGTIHVADSRVSAIPAPVAKAISRSRLLAMEITPVAVADDRLVDLELLDDGGRLEPLLGAETYDRIRVELTANGTPEAVVARLKPWAAMMKMNWGRPRGDARTQDENLLAAARAAGLRFISLESIDEQVAAFDAVPLASQVALLRNAVEHRDAIEATAEPTVAAWLRGDLAGIARINARYAERFPGMAPHYAALTRQLIDGRTVLMHHRLFMPLRAGGVFVAVGAAHLPGEGGLLALVARDGYRVTRAW